MNSINPYYVPAELDYRRARALSSRPRRRSRVTYATWIARNRMSDAH